MNWTKTGGRYAPRGHEREHDKRLAHRRIVLIASLGGVPLGQAEHLHEEEAKEHEKDDPEREQAENNGQTSAEQTKLFHQQRGQWSTAFATYTAVLNSLFRLFIRCTNLNAMLTKKSF